MKALLILLLLPFAVLGQQQVVKYPGYVSYWNPKTLIPDSVIWVASAHAKLAGRFAGFHSTGNRPNLDRDYAKSGFDIGHNCDASDENGNKTDEFNSFDFVNTYPQRPNCNRITWLAIENYTRALNVPVTVKVSYLGISGHIGKDNVAVPIICVKELWYNGKYERFNVINADTSNRHDFRFYQRFPKVVPKKPILN